MNKKEIGKYLEKLREDRKFTRSDVATQLGTIYKSVLDWENGVMPNVNSLIKLADLYKVSIDDILECGKQVTNDELYRKHSILMSSSMKLTSDAKHNHFTPYQTRLLETNNRLKELILLFRKRTLTRSEDTELRFLFDKMCCFTSYYEDHFDNKVDDKYLRFIEVLNKAKDDSSSGPEYYYEVKKYIDVVNAYQLKNPYPIFAKKDKEEIKDQQFKSLENWEKDFYLALIQNSDIITYNPSSSPMGLKDYEERFGETFDKEIIVKRFIRYFIENGAMLNPWLLSFKIKRRIPHNILDRLEDTYIDYIKPIFINFFNQEDEEDGEYKYAYVENNDETRFLDNYFDDYSIISFFERIDPKTLLKMFAMEDEKDIVEALFSLHKKYGEDRELVYRYKKAEVSDELDRFYKCRDLFLNDNKHAKEMIEQANELEKKIENGESVFYEYEIEDILNKDFDHWHLMNDLKNQITYSGFLKNRDKTQTESLLKDLDVLSLQEIREKYFAKEEVEEGNE